MKELKKSHVLIVTDSLNTGGIETYVLNLVKYINKDIYQVSVLVLDKNRLALAEEIKKHGANVIIAQSSNKWYRLRLLFKIVKDSKVDLVHMQIRYTYLIAIAKMCGAKVILHSHFAFGQDNMSTIRKKIMLFVIKHCCSKLLACSEDAGKIMFSGLPYEFVRNGVDFERFIFDELERVKIRKKYKLNKKNKILVQVGKINDRKNPLFSLDVLRELLTISQDFRLFLIGDGELTPKVKAKISELKLNPYVIMTGSLNDASAYYSASDILLHPALAEGLPFTLIEAQANGLYCVVSDTVTKDANISGKMKFLSLKDTPNHWAHQINHCLIANMKTARVSSLKLARSEYNIKNSIKQIENIYREVLN